MPNKINKLKSAKRNKKDEFYTRYEDIEKELSHYPNAFEGKTVYCNCDDPHWSAFPRYFLLNFRKLGLKRLISTCWNGLPDNTTPTLFDTPTPTDRIAWKLDVSDCVCSESDFDEFVNTHCEELTGNGSFFSSECVALLKECDIVCTNPPYSLFCKYFPLLTDNNKDVLILGSVFNVLKRPVFPLIKAGKLFAEGWLDAVFSPPVPTCWLTTLHSDRIRSPLPLTKKYSKDLYPTYDNYDAIEVPCLADIPSDFDGAMGVPMSFLEKHCPEQFEIVGISRGFGMGGLFDKEFLKQDVEKCRYYNVYINGKSLYDRIFIKRKNFTEHPHNAT